MVDRLQEDLRQAQLARDEVKVSTLRLLLSEIKNAEIAKGSEVEEQDVVSIIGREVKKRKEAAAGFRSGGREDQAQKEEAESKILMGFLPTQLTNEELTKLVERAINELGATSAQDMGKVMAAVMAEVAGRADGGMVSALVKEKLS